jgi:hypothetical protein
LDENAIKSGVKIISNVRHARIAKNGNEKELYQAKVHVIIRNKMIEMAMRFIGIKPKTLKIL